MKNIKNPDKRNLWFERFMAILATVNLSLVLFDLSYVQWRDLYLQKFPQIVQIYDPIKGIETHRDTKKYLQTLDALEEQVSQTGLQSPEVKNQLEEITRLSNEMIDTNPFAGANKSGTLEKIKNRMRDRVNNESAKQSFAIFWSQPYLTQKGWLQEINFFNQRIRPLIATNYYRRIAESGEFINNFWIIDSVFVILFALELLGRTFFIKRQHLGLSWLEALLWRWYDLLLLLPFFRWLRIIPVLVRLDQAKLLSLHPVRRQINQGIVANFAEELTEIVVVRVINQVQASIKRGELIRWLSQQENVRSYIDINNVNEIEAIAGLLIKTVVYQVLPEIQPAIVALLRHNIETVIHQVPVYRNLQNLPGIGQAQSQLSEQLATQITTNLYKTLVSAVEDPVGAKLTSQLIQSFSDALTGQIKKKHLLAEIESLLSDFLEEIKINYVQRLSQEDIEQIIEQTRQLRTQASLPAVVDKGTSLTGR
ncbi:MAG: hypothetical protein RMY62_030120 [Nostoc sp. ZfuVER08]|jgi:hypothetical protein|uniref:Uridine phosphorylase n=1 Tax=Nostoc punctiforme FACHB-252 TaxID=1357509 RepID=A0ABR8H607_NOSPU|nr:hypothetical protein [Nostoc punctiforme]MBD2610600.1 hypothetical protein [Nostoc punctiforme FACHB-252]MBL1198380.1 hypothetical protein [Nostoc sp. GBBB01]MDZ8011728.1 hypothetical protein [Nostoc sp. ZfuVER08]